MKSKTLKTWLLSQHGKKGVRWLSEQLKVTQPSIYEQLKKENLGDSFMHKLDKAGLTFQINGNKIKENLHEKKENHIEPQSEILDTYRQLSDVLRELKEAKQTIKDLEDELIIKDKENQALKKDLSIYTKNIAQ